MAINFNEECAKWPVGRNPRPKCPEGPQSKFLVAWSYAGLSKFCDSVWSASFWFPLTIPNWKILHRCFFFSLSLFQKGNIPGPGHLLASLSACKPKGCGNHLTTADFWLPFGFLFLETHKAHVQCPQSRSFRTTFFRCEVVRLQRLACAALFLNAARFASPQVSGFGFRFGWRCRFSDGLGWRCRFSDGLGWRAVLSFFLICDFRGRFLPVPACLFLRKEWEGGGERRERRGRSG